MGYPWNLNLRSLESVFGRKRSKRQSLTLLWYSIKGSIGTEDVRSEGCSCSRFIGETLQ